MVVVAFFAITMIFSAAGAAAQDAAGPLPAAAPSDQPVAQSNAQAATQIGGHPSLAGSWALNKDQSDDPRQKMREAMGNSGGQGGDGGRGGMGGGGQRGGGMGGGRGQGRGEGGGMNEFSQLTIVQTATSAKVTGSSGHVLALYSSSDASKRDQAAPGNSGNAEEENAPAAAQWKDNQLVAVTQGRRAGSTTRTYELSPDGKQLYVTTKMDNPRFQQPVTIRFVYDPAQTNK